MVCIINLLIINFLFLFLTHIVMIPILLMKNVMFFRAYAIVMQTRDKIERLLKYDPRTKNVTMLLRGLSFSNGVALNKDNDFVLVTETTVAKVIRYWL